MTRNILNEILEYNDYFIKFKKYEKYITTKQPDKKLIILSCMDTRLTELLPKAMNIKNGDAKIIKNAGATIVHPFGSIARSIVVGIYEFNAEDVIVIGHYGCGMNNLNSDYIIDKMKEKGISESTIDILSHAGYDINKWLKGFESVEQSIKESVNAIKTHPLVHKDVKVHGLIMDPETGRLEVIVDGNENN